MENNTQKKFVAVSASDLFGKTMHFAEYVLHSMSCYHDSVLDSCFQYAEKAERDKQSKEMIKTLVQSGASHILPYRLTILKGEMMLGVSMNGRARQPMSAQMKGEFTQAEISPLKRCKPYKVQTGLWSVGGCPNWYYGSIGISGENGKIDRDNADLVILFTEDWVRVEVFLFEGLAGSQQQIDCLPFVMDYLFGWRHNNNGARLTTNPITNRGSYDNL